MSTSLSYEADSVCADCGCFGAYAFANESLCAACYHQRGSCCAERDCGDADNAAAPAREFPAPPVGAIATLTANSPTAALPTTAVSSETHRLNPNCCYKACPRCSSVRRLREFQSRYPDDWRTRLRGLPRLIAAAQLRD